MSILVGEPVALPAKGSEGQLGDLVVLLAFVGTSGQLMTGEALVGGSAAQVLVVDGDRGVCQQSRLQRVPILALGLLRPLLNEWNVQTK